MHAVSTNQIANILHFNGNIPKMLASGKSILTPAKSRRYVLLLLYISEFLNILHDTVLKTKYF